MHRRAGIANSLPVLQELHPGTSDWRKFEVQTLVLAVTLQATAAANASDLQTAIAKAFASAATSVQSTGNCCPQVDAAQCVHAVHCYVMLSVIRVLVDAISHVRLEELKMQASA